MALGKLPHLSLPWSFIHYIWTVNKEAGKLIPVKHLGECQVHRKHVNKYCHNYPSSFPQLLNLHMHVTEVFICLQALCSWLHMESLKEQDLKWEGLCPGDKQPWAFFSRFRTSLVRPIFPSFIRNKIHECPDLTCNVLSTTVRGTSLNGETTPLLKEGFLSEQGCFHWAMVSDSFLLCSV